MPITRSNVDAMLDAGRIAVLMAHGRKWKARRSGKTRTWKRDPSRIYIPFKVGLKGHGYITDADFLPSGELNPEIYTLLGE